RHTRFSRDWSSDVCSSDLTQFAQPLADIGVFKDKIDLFIQAIDKGLWRTARRHHAGPRKRLIPGHHGLFDSRQIRLGIKALGARSEERRVGKECSSGGWTY